jgi:hypothetical protein
VPRAGAWKYEQLASHERRLRRRREDKHLVDEAAEAGSVAPGAGEIASRAFDFAGLTVAQVMSDPIRGEGEGGLGQLRHPLASPAGEVGQEGVEGARSFGIGELQLELGGG